MTTDGPDMISTQSVIAGAQALAARVAGENSPPAASTHDDSEEKVIRSGSDFLVGVFVVVPFIGLIVAAAMMWNHGFTLLDLGMLIVMYSITMLGAGLGFHRLFTHRSFETYNWVRYTFAIMGSMAAEGHLIKWVAMHRRHHQFSDKPEDPHSPHQHGDDFAGMMKGIWHSHVGWLFDPHPEEVERYVGDLRHDKGLALIDKLFPLWVSIGLLAPAAVGGLVTGTWFGAFTGFLWGGLVRIFLVHHVTWSVNSVCHIWGTKPFRSNDESRNNFLFAIPSFGESWHNTHHAFPTNARHGLKWWQLDISFITIKILTALGLAWKVKLQKPDALAAKARQAETASV